MASKKNALVGWAVLTFGRQIAKRKARKSPNVKRNGAIAAAIAGVGAAVGGLVFWRSRRGKQEESPSP